MVFTSETAPRTGRKPGARNRFTTDAREAVIKAASEGYEDGLVGYFREMRTDRPETFDTAVLKCIRTDISADVSVTSRVQLIQAAMMMPQELVDQALVAFRAMPIAKEIEAEVKP